MTEQEWLHCTDPAKLLEFVRGKASDRKFRLFAASCCRRLWKFMLDERVRSAVEVAERYADGIVGDEAREDAKFDVDEAAMEILNDIEERRIRNSYTFWDAARAAHAAVCTEADPDGPHADRAAEAAANGVESHVRDGLSDWKNASAAKQEEKGIQACLVRDIFGPLPFRTVIIDPSWLIWNDGTIRRLADTVYENRCLPEGTLDRDRLAVLADAFDEAGCTNEEILSHCRSQSDHVRGCWLLDLILDKE